MLRNSKSKRVGGRQGDILEISPAQTESRSRVYRQRDQRCILVSYCGWGVTEETKGEKQ